MRLDIILRGDIYSLILLCIIISRIENIPIFVLELDANDKVDKSVKQRSFATAGLSEEQNGNRFGLFFRIHLMRWVLIDF